MAIQDDMITSTFRREITTTSHKSVQLYWVSTPSGLTKTWMPKSYMDQKLNTVVLGFRYIMNKV